MIRTETNLAAVYSTWYDDCNNEIRDTAGASSTIHSVNAVALQASSGKQESESVIQPLEASTVESALQLSTKSNQRPDKVGKYDLVQVTHNPSIKENHVLGKADEGEGGLPVAQLSTKGGVVNDQLEDALKISAAKSKADITASSSSDNSNSAATLKGKRSELSESKTVTASGSEAATAPRASSHSHQRSISQNVKPTAKDKPTCKYFSKGKGCQRGDKCGFLHTMPESSSNTLPSATSNHQEASSSSAAAAATIARPSASSKSKSTDAQQQHSKQAADSDGADNIEGNIKDGKNLELVDTDEGAGKAKSRRHFPAAAAAPSPIPAPARPSDTPAPVPAPKARVKPTWVNNEETFGW